MNALLSEPTSAAFGAASLDDKYRLRAGRAFMSGVQALVRLPIMQQQRDAAQGHKTAGFISGYRGSPLGAYDQALLAAQAHLAANQIVFQPGVNEELAATAIWGTQQLDLYPQSKKYHGVFGIWYGKGPGVDRSADVFKHANMAGTAALGGVLAVAGDDHLSKSSTAAHQSDHIFQACALPVFFPSDVQGILDLGLHALALSRFCGLWAGMKTIQEVVESSSSVQLDLERVNIIVPSDFSQPAGGLHIRWPDAPLVQEARLIDYKLNAALAYIRANRLNYNVYASAHDRFGIIASGKAFNDTRQALANLGLDAPTCQRMGLRLHKVNVVWPLEPLTTREFAQGLSEVLVVEEKRPIIEHQLKEQLYHWRMRPCIVGKFDNTEDAGDPGSGAETSAHALLRANADLNPALIARAIAKRLIRLGVAAEVHQRIDQHLAQLDAKARLSLEIKSTGAERAPWFCSGCPHNTSTRVPAGSRAMAGIGCHFMAVWMDRSTSTFSQMGGEGAAWVGQQPFTSEAHVFVNLGDGTYFHSGLLAIRQAIAAGVNITYKILYNDAVAMTGGQRVGERPEGHSVRQIMGSLCAEGVARLVIVTDEPAKYHATALASGVTVHPRDQLDRVQRELRELRGTTVIIYDQTCATEKRRRRKRGLLAEPDERIVINALVCEGCGDCSEQSNCLSIEPLETEWGRKRQINQSTCNKDYSCIKGFCPSFVTVKGGQIRPPGQVAPPSMKTLAAATEPLLPSTATVWAMVVAGVGGSGVITIGQLLGIAAHLDGKSVVTQDAGGLAQKGGSTWSYIQIAAAPEAIYSNKVDTAQANLVLGCDAIVTASSATLALMQPARTQVVLNIHSLPTAAFVHNRDWEFPQQACSDAIASTVGASAVHTLDAEWVAVQALGDSIYSNPLLLGYAWQIGQVPLSLAAIWRAFELNGVQVANNQAAFSWGRHCAYDLAAVQALLGGAPVPPAPLALDAQIKRRMAYLTAYQDAAYAQRYQAQVARVQALDLAWGKTDLTQAVFSNLFKLMAYKDEYEVARLYTEGSFARQIAARFTGKYTLYFHLAPPLLAAKNEHGELIKKRYRPGTWWLFKVLARLKGLRGSAFDIFAYSTERRRERALIEQYCRTLETLTQALASARQTPQAQARYRLALEIARVPEQIKGFGHVKARQLDAAQQRWQALLTKFNQA